MDKTPETPISNIEQWNQIWNGVVLKIKPILEQKFKVQLRYTGRISIDDQNVGLPEFALIYTTKDVNEGLNGETE